MAHNDEDRHRERIASTIAVAALHAALLYLLMAGFGVTIRPETGRALKVIEIVEVPPPPATEDKPPPLPARSPDREGAASPANLKARASPILVPPPRVRLDPPPVPVAAMPAEGLEAESGASERPGEGSGRGGSGAGDGSGRSGSGSGGGGVVTGARLVAGRILDSDYPRAASRSGATGTVIVHLAVGPNGRVAGCRLARSSGSADLDEATCRLARERFRYSPARDAQGRAVADTVGWKQIWWQEPRGR